MLKFENVTFRYPNSDNDVLSNVDFEIPKEKWITILGSNGSGKSTITKLICGQYSDYKGKIYVDNILHNEKNYEKIIKKIAIVFQNPDNQFVGMTVEEDIAFGLENNNVKTEDMTSIIDNVLKKVDMLEFKKREPRELSGGQKQRIAIASALSVNPQILILDEATSMLDPKGKHQILTYIKKISLKENITIISITHDIEELKYSDDIILIDKGKIITQTKSQNLYNNKELLEKYNLEIPLLYKLKSDINNHIEFDYIENTDNKERILDKLCKLILKK